MNNNSEKLRKKWIDSLNMYVKNEKDFNYLDILANQLFTDISIENPKVDDIFFASLEYFVELKNVSNKDFEKINSDIKKMIEILNNKNATIKDFEKIWKD